MMAPLVATLRDGQAVIVATDTVYGLAARPGSAGYAHIFELKDRPMSQVLPWLVSGADALDALAIDVPAYAYRLAQMFWPGALTLVLRASDAACELGGVAVDKTIALRCPDDADLLALLGELEGPLACTSANIHGQTAVSSKDELHESLAVLPGADELPAYCQGGQASTIVDCTGTYPKILREGPIPEQVILDVAMFGATLTSHE
ncbi:MAG: L-threonylcarbamoyladenylate synthase [Coriobacteriales bacterium]